MIRVLSDRVAVEHLPGVGMIGAIHVPNVTKSSKNQTFTRAKVVAAGPKVELAKVGTTVLVSEFFGDEVDVDGKRYWIGRERDLVGVIES